MESEEPAVMTATEVVESQGAMMAALHRLSDAVGGELVLDVRVLLEDFDDGSS